MSRRIRRAQYGVYLLDPRADRAAPTMAILQEAEYEPQHFLRYTDLMAAVGKQPPHLIFFHRTDEQNNLPEIMQSLREFLPETHFIVLSSAGGLAATWREWGDIIYDCVLSPPVHPQQLVQAVDRAAERDALVYQTELLSQKSVSVDPTPVPPTREERREAHIEDLNAETNEFLASILADSELAASAPPSLAEESTKTGVDGLVSGEEFTFPSAWHQLTQTVGIEELTRETVAILSHLAGGAPTLFLRYMPSRRCLTISAAENLPAEAWRGLGLNLAEEPDFRLSDLHLPERIAGLRDMVQALVGGEGLWAQPLLIRDEVFGLFVVMASPDKLPISQLALLLEMAASQAQLIDLRHQIHSLATIDPATQLISRTTFRERLHLEIARARRIHWPVSLLMISLDQHREILTTYGDGERNVALRALGKIFTPRGRVNDLLGRLDSGDLGLLLPHTPVGGAAVKAERLRRLIETAAFGRLLPKFPRLTVSIGVSEYPSCCRDADELFVGADEALWEVKRAPGNKVCVMQPASGFVPDFAFSKR